MRKITDYRELREIQMQIMDKIHEYCVDNKLDYSISSGTLLGAIRHKGYIPWDDDIDIYMPRDSYDKFVEQFNNCNDRYKLINIDVDDNYPYPFTKVIDTHTYAKENRDPEYNSGIWVDVFVVDGVPNSVFCKKIKSYVFRFLNMLFYFKVGSRKINRPIDVLYKIIPLSPKNIFHLLEYVRKTKKNTQLIGNVSMVSMSMYFQRNCMDSYIDVLFENRHYKAMCGFDEYLKATYNDYMTIPPENERVHHDFEAYFIN